MKGLEVKKSPSYFLAILLCFKGTESSKSIINPSVSEASAFFIQSSLLAGIKRGLRGKDIKIVPNQNLLKTFFLFEQDDPRHQATFQYLILLLLKPYTYH